MSEKAKNKVKATDFSDYLAKELKDPEAKKLYDYYDLQLRVSYQILQIRKQVGLSQKEFAEKIGTAQSNVARIESGKQNFTIDFLQKIAKTFNKNIEVTIG